MMYECPLMKFKELEKVKQELAARRQNSNNPFLTGSQKTDHSVYKELYKFDIKVRLFLKVDLTD